MTESETLKKIKSFFRTDWFVKKSDTRLESQSHFPLSVANPVQSTIQAEVDTLITLNQPKLVQQFVDNGYRFTSQQMKNILIHKQWWFSYYTDMGNLFKKQPEMLRETIPFFMDYLKLGLTSRHILVGEKTESINLKKTWEALEVIWTHCSYALENDAVLFQTIINDIKKLDNFYTNFYQEKKTVYQDYNGLREQLLIISEYPSTHLRLLSDLYVEVSKEHIQKKLDDTKLYYASTISELGQMVGHLINKELNQVNQSTLPPESLTIIQSIQELIAQINQDDLDNAQKWQVDNLLTKRLPQVYRDYLGISESYRTTLTDNQGRNPNELFVSSLRLIEGEIKQIMESIQESKFHNLKVTNRYLQNIS